MMFELLKKILELISPQLREVIKNSLDEWELKAKETPSIVDDILVLFIKKLFGF